MRHNWNDLVRIAREEETRLMRSLPPDLADKARTVPVTYQGRPGPDIMADGIEADTLGLFIGNAFPDSMAGGDPLPPQVILFLENLWDEAEGREKYFRQEIRTTLLHELGHYLGLNEDDLGLRGID